MLFFFRFAAFGAGDSTSLRIYREELGSNSDDDDDEFGDIDEEEEDDDKPTVTDCMKESIHLRIFSSHINLFKNTS